MPAPAAAAARRVALGRTLSTAPAAGATNGTEGDEALRCITWRRRCSISRRSRCRRGRNPLPQLRQAGGTRGGGRGVGAAFALHYAAAVAINMPHRPSAAACCPAAAGAGTAMHTCLVPTHLPNPAPQACGLKPSCRHSVASLAKLLTGYREAQGTHGGTWSLDNDAADFECNSFERSTNSPPPAWPGKALAWSSGSCQAWGSAGRNGVLTA